MNPTYVPLAQYSAASMLPFYDPHLALQVFGGTLAVSLIPLLIYIVRLMRATTASSVSKDKSDAPSAPGVVHTALAVLSMLVVLPLGYLFLFYLNAWHVAGGYDCSDQTPNVHARYGRAAPDENLCFNTKARVEGQAAGVAQKAQRFTQGVAHDGMDVINGGNR